MDDRAIPRQQFLPNGCRVLYFGTADRPQSIAWVIACITLALTAGCADKPTDNSGTPALKASQSLAQSLAQAPSPTREAAQRLQQHVAQEDFTGAFVELEQLRHHRSLTPEQMETLGAVEESVLTGLRAAAQKGNQEAADTLQYHLKSK